MTVLAHLPALERRLVAADFPAMTAWWRTNLETFYASGKRQCVLRVGRRGGKSTSLCRVAVLEALYGEHVIPPGDVGVVAIISVSRDEASQRLRTVRALLAALAVKSKPIDGGVELEHRPIVFKVYAASIAGMSGFTCICAIGDEVAKWRDSDTGANPASEVLASLRPTMAGQPSARLFLSSSPMGRMDAHAKAFDEGDTQFQTVAQAATWIARPTLTEAECTALEPDADTFAREYGAIPFDGSTLSIFTEPMLLACTRRGPVTLPRERGVTYVAATDPATRSNEWSLAIARVTDSEAVQIVLVRGWRAPRGGALAADETMREIASILRDYGIDELWQDQWSFDALRAIAGKYEIELRQEPMTQTRKVQMFDALKRRMTDGTIELPDDALVRSDLVGVRKWISKGGAFSIELERQGGRHSDHAQSIALVTAKAGTAMPAWERAMVAIEKREEIIAHAPVEVSLSIFGGAYAATVQGLKGTAYFEPSDRAPSFSHDTEQAFRLRIMNWLVSTPNHGIGHGGIVPGDKPKLYPSYCALCQGNIMGGCKVHVGAL